MTQAASQEPSQDDLSGKAHSRQSPTKWRFPIYCGAGFCALQVLVYVGRFGSAGYQDLSRQMLGSIFPMLSGLVLFFIAGLLAGMLVQWFLRDTRGGWRKFVICAVAVAIPFSVWLSLVGGLLGPVGALIYCLAPFLLLVGIPALVRWTWLRLARSAASSAS